VLGLRFGEPPAADQFREFFHASRLIPFRPRCEPTPDAADID